MSTRHLLNIGIGTVAILLAASVGLVFNSLGDQKTDQARIDLAVSQQGLVQDIYQQVETLSQAGNLVLVRQARQQLGSSILLFDQNLATLLNGGTITDQDGKEIKVAELWIQTGLPLADLAAGEFSIFSSAGQNAVAGIKDNGAELVNHLSLAATGMQAEVQTRHARGSLARWMVLGLTAALIGLGLFRFKPVPKTTSQAIPQTPLAPMATAPVDEATVETPAAASALADAQVWNSQPHKQFTSPVDFDNVNASVDQLSVDMNTIASSTDKMGLAIGSVGHAMQGMLFSLQQMAQDTAEGYKIVRGANNAASYTHNTAGELAESAQEMSRVVARVTQLAMKTKQVAGQIEAEAVSTGSTGEAFTSVVASEVKGLAQQTSLATAGIEQTVAEILGTARQYEEAIGQILKNISGINKVSENFGEMMLHPPNAGVAGTPLPAAVPLPLTPQPEAVCPVAQPVAQPIAPPVVQPEAPAPAEPAAEAAPVDDAAPAPEPDSWDQADDPVVNEPTSEEVAEETTAAIEETAADPEPSGSAGNVFMLGGAPKKAKAKSAPAEEPKEEPKAEVPTPPPAPEPVEEEDDGANIFMLNKPKKAPGATNEEPAAVAAEPAPEPAPEPEPEPAPKAEEPAAEEDKDDGANIFMLNKPSKESVAEKEDTPAPVAEEASEEKEELVTVPAEAEEEKKDDGDSNIFMLNKPK